MISRSSNPTWSNLWDYFKDRRHASLFLMTLLAFPVVVILAPAMVFAAVRFPFQAWSARRRRGKRDKFPPLSSDELRVARSKLLRTPAGKAR